jgi:hypothetical protein
MPHKEHHLKKFGNIVLLTFTTGFYQHQYIWGMDCKGLMHRFHNLATPNIKLEQTMHIAFVNINNIKLNVDINIVAMIQSQMK